MRTGLAKKLIGSFEYSSTTKMDDSAFAKSQTKHSLSTLHAHLVGDRLILRLQILFPGMHCSSPLASDFHYCPIRCAFLNPCQQAFHNGKSRLLNHSNNALLLGVEPRYVQFFYHIGLKLIANPSFQQLLKNKAARIE